ncbi:MAG: hypothetical protein CL434_02445 [Acidimicrobiaceae bacterium]|jgi:peroxiredoxin Q/BCP|nr:hypothetical protein [Acidimicrobiaceae bacterium]|tara:strand:- start:1128 stop:1373 length:246 start_codon:yes stop_codon:yes gene_type:complete
MHAETIEAQLKTGEIGVAKWYPRQIPLVSGGSTFGRIRMLEVGTSAPAFSLLDHNSEQVSLDEFAGQWLLFWWYPKASTPG